MNADEIVKALERMAPQFQTPGKEVVSGAADLIESLQSQLAESQRREQAAVEDLNGTGACFTCKHFRRNGGDCFGAGRCRLDGVEIWPCNKPGVYRAEVPDDGRQTYEWRGPQGAGEGATK